MTVDLHWYPTPPTLDWVPKGFPLNVIAQQIEHTGIYTDNEDISGIRAQIQHAHSLGIDLKVVCLSGQHPSHTFLSDLANYLERKQAGTYLVMDQHNAAVASNMYPRVVLERSELRLSLDKPDQAVAQFVSALQIKEFPWTFCVMGIFLIAILCTLSARFLHQWGKNIRQNLAKFISEK